jgi:hypothetical protein
LNEESKHNILALHEQGIDESQGEQVVQAKPDGTIDDKFIDWKGSPSERAGNIDSLKNKDEQQPT